jgi:nascent polypeptide-associated complex subunit beta
VRRKVKKTSKNSAGEQAKLANALKKINAQPVPAIQEVNMFKEDGQVIHFAVPKGMSICTDGETDSFDL